MESMSWVTLNLIDSRDAMLGGGPPRFEGRVGGCAWLAREGWVAMARSGRGIVVVRDRVTELLVTVPSIRIHVRPG